MESYIKCSITITKGRRSIDKVWNMEYKIGTSNKSNKYGKW